MTTLFRPRSALKTPNPRLAAFQVALSAKGVDGCLVFSDHNRNYLTRFTGSSGALVASARQALFLTDSRYTVQAKEEVQGARVLLQTKALLIDAAILAKRLGLRRLGVEADHVTLAQAKALKKLLGPKVRLVPLRGVVEGLRQVKSGEEKERLREAGRLTDRAFRKLLPRIKPGLRERDLAGELEHLMRREGASGPSFDSIVASGWRGALPHGVASDKKVARGELIVFDFGALLHGYCSDMTRTVALGRPSAQQRKVYTIVRDAQAYGLEAVREGKPASAVDKAARDHIRKKGYGRCFGHGTGHGVGVEVHEEPRVGPSAKALLKAGEAITVEPGIYLEGRFGVRIEDLVLVTPTGHENMYRTTKELIVL